MSSVNTKTRISDWETDSKLLLLQGWAIDGLTIQDIANNIGINKKTLYDWMHKSSNICNALKIGREQADYTIVNALYNKAKSGDTTAMIFWLKNRISDKWRERQDNNVNFVGQDFEIKINKKEENAEYKT